MTDPEAYERIRAALDAAASSAASEALPLLRAAAEEITRLIDESMAAALLTGDASLRSAGASAGLSENAVGPRLARTQALAAYADERGRVTAAGVERARYDRETGAQRHVTATQPPLRFKPRRSTS